MPISNLRKTAEHRARHAAPTTRSIVLVAASMILTACGDGNSASTSKGNSAPSISGKPQDVAIVNQPYSFKPNAYDPDGDVLIFQVSKLPPWATLNPATGEITGVPPTGATGTFSDIQITVTDGDLTTALPAFSITVTESPSTPTSGTKSAKLSWSAPTQNDDGSPLSDLAGYRIYYGTASGGMNQRVDITNPATTSIEIPGLSSGTWYFAMSSVNAAGIESARTGAVTIAL